jgi:hypothetical protein
MSLNLQDWRDVIIIAAGSLTILVLLAIFILTVVLGLAAKTLIGTVQGLLKDEVKPLLGSAQQTVQRIHGTTTFIGETTVAPVVRVYGAVAGVRRLIGVLSGITGRRNPRG